MPDPVSTVEINPTLRAAILMLMRLFLFTCAQMRTPKDDDLFGMSSSASSAKYRQSTKNTVPIWCGHHVGMVFSSSAARESQWKNPRHFDSTPLTIGHFVFKLTAVFDSPQRKPG